MHLGLGRLEVLRRRLEYLYDVVGDLAVWRRCLRLYLHVAQLLVVEIALLFHAFDLFEERLMLEQLSGKLVL